MVVKELGNKNVFWQALIVALIIFWAGIMLGVMFEDSRFDKLQDFYFNSETDIFDTTLGNEILTDFDFNCNSAIEKSINFADKIYFEAISLEKYDSSNAITENIIQLHRRYDLLRVMLWKNVVDLKENCDEELNDTNIIVYFYDYVDPNLNVKARQTVMGRVLLDVKEKYGDKVILIPIAYDTKVYSLDLMIERYSVEDVPSILINQNYKIEDLFTL